MGGKRERERERERRERERGGGRRMSKKQNRLTILNMFRVCEFRVEGGGGGEYESLIEKVPYYTFVK